MLEKLDEVRGVSLPWFLAKPDPSVYLGDEWLVLDFETTNLDKGSALNLDNRLILATWSTKDGSFHKKGGEYEQNELLAGIKSAKFIVAHNAKFELQWLERMGVDISCILVYDTLLGEYVYAGNRSWRLDLDSCAARYGLDTKNSLVKYMMSSGVSPEDMPSSILVKYGIQDTEVAKNLFLAQRKVLHDLNLLPVLYTRCLTTNVLASIEANGMQLDSERVTAEFNRVSEELAKYELALNNITGGINPNSPKQLAEFVYDRLGFEEIRDQRGEPVRTSTGNRKCSEEILSILKARTEEQSEFLGVILKRQEANTKLKSLKKMMACVEENNGILIGRFNQSVTGTHRLSSSGSRYKLQFQNFARAYKPLFRARKPGWRVGEADGAQLEFRVAAHLGRDRQAATDIRNKVDVHKNTAAALLSIPIEKVTKALRQDAKPETFRPLYGSKGQTPAQKRYASFFQSRYKGIYDTQTGWTFDVLAAKELTTEWGLKFYWPDTQVGRSGYISNTTNIFNYPVQSFATAEIIPISLVYFWHRLVRLPCKTFLTNTIHDSIIGEVAPGEDSYWKALSYQAFTFDTYKYLKEVYNVEFTVPLGVEVKIGEYWSEGEGESWDVEPPTGAGVTAS